MKRRMLLFVLLCSASALPAAEDPAAPSAADREASRLEVELVRFKDSSPESADVMARLVDLYHADGRVFGLIRTGRKFAAAQISDPRHKDVMVKLIDGLESLSRNEDMVAACRQFLQRYGDEPASAQVEVRLARTLQRMPDRLATAAAWQAVWQRQPGTPAGRQAGARAMALCQAVGSAEAVQLGAELADDMVQQLPPGPLVGEVGARGFHLLTGAGKQAEANALGIKILAKGGVTDNRLLGDLHWKMATNYQQLQQYANAVESLRKAMAIDQSAELHSLLIVLLSSARAEPVEIEAAVASYLQKYPQRPDHHDRQALIARAYENAEQPQKALAQYKKLLPLDPMAQDAARRFVSLNGYEPEQLAETERLLLDAIQQCPQRADYVTYILATEIYDRRMKDRPRARSFLRDHVLAAQSGDRYAVTSAQWLLRTADDEADFRADVDRLAAMLRQAPEKVGRSDYLTGAIAGLRGDPKKRPMVAYLQSTIQELSADPVLGFWFGYRTRGVRDSDRLVWARMLDPAVFDQLSQPMRLAVASRAAGQLRYQSRQGGQRLRAYSLWFELARDDYPAAAGLFLVATEENRPEQAKQALQGLLKLDPPPSVDSGICAAMMGLAAREEDADLGRTVFAWVKKADAVAAGPIVDYRIGDSLWALGMEKEALDYWKSAMLLNRDHSYSYNCASRVRGLTTGPERAALDKQLAEAPGLYQGYYLSWIADDQLVAGDFAGFEKTLRDLLASEQQRTARKPTVDGGGVVYSWLDFCRNNEELADANRRRVLSVIRDLDAGTPSAIAHVMLLDAGEAEAMRPTQRLLAYQAASHMVGRERYDWDRMLPSVRVLMEREEYGSAAALLTGLLANVSNLDETRRDATRALTTQCYAKIGAVGMTIDEQSPLAPLLRAALYLRLGDERLAFEAFTAHRSLFAAHRSELPGDLLLFACERLIAAGGERNLTDVETWLREWLIRNSRPNQSDDELAAQVQLLLARGYFKAQRFDVARAEFLTLTNGYPDAPEALEAEFGIGETYVAQKVYDQASAVFDRLAQSTDTEVVVRAEFLRGVVAFQRDDVDEAREIFRAVLDRVPTIELADKALFRLSEIYGLQQRYLQQLTLLRTVGRLGRTSKRTHTPGEALSIVVYDSDLGISRGHNWIPVLVTTEPGGDQEQIHLTSAGAGKGLFRADLDTRLGQSEPGNRILELTGRDTIRCDYPEEFREQFRNVPLSDVQILIAADAKLEVASTKEFEEEKVTFSEELQEEVEEPDMEVDPRMSQVRPLDQIKPGNPLYVRVTDVDRDLTDGPDDVIVKVAGSSGDQVQASLRETGPHSGVFEGMVNSGELPAGATASDAAIGQAPILAIDHDPKTYWQSEPDGRTPKALTVDMKDLRRTAGAKFTVPDPTSRVPVRAELQASYDGQFWFRLGGLPAIQRVEPVAGTFGRMKRRVYGGDYTRIREWSQVVDLTLRGAAIEEADAEELTWSRPLDADDADQPFAVVFHGKLVQGRAGAARIRVAGARTALVIDGRAELPLGDGARSVDVWLSPGTHEVTVFAAAAASARQPIGATWARANLSSADVALRPLLPTDFDLSVPEAETPGLPAQEAQCTRDENFWEFRFEPVEVRYVRFLVHEYLGDAVSIAQVEVFGEQPDEKFIPPEVDVVALARNQALEIAGGETITATYIDEVTPGDSGRARVLNAALTATYFDGDVSPIVYSFEAAARGGVNTLPRRVLRIDPGERFIVQVRDYDEDRSNDPDVVPIEIVINDGPPLALTATETLPNSGIFTKEIDTSTEEESDRIAVKPGDRIFCRYADNQNTFPGHGVVRESVVLVNQPTAARVRILDTLVQTQRPGSRPVPRDRRASSWDRRASSWISYRRPPEGRDVGQVALAAPMTIEVIDPDAAKHAESSVVVALTCGDGPPLDVRCILPQDEQGPGNDNALLEGRFIGQVFLQLGGKESPDLVPLTAGMTRLVGGPVMEEEEEETEQQRIGWRTRAPTSTRALNVRGSDLIAATCPDPRRPDGEAVDLVAKARLIENGLLECTDQSYADSVEELYLGERLYVRLIDPDQDTSEARDVLAAEITSSSGERETVQIEETLPHSGVFTGSFPLSVAEKPTPANLDPADPAIEAFFGDTVTVRRLDTTALTKSGELELVIETPVVIGTDGQVAAFTKTFEDEQLAVETRFTVAECHFELFKSHRQLDRQEEANTDLEAGRAVLRELMEERLDSRYAPRVAYLLGQFAQELGQWDEAISAYQKILRQHGEHPLAPDAQYKLAQCYEKMDDFDLALEAYVALAATYPNSPLVANVMIRIADHFFQNEQFDVAAQVGGRFVEKFEGHQHAARMAFRVGQCHYKAGEFVEAGGAFDEFARVFAEDELCSEALFWGGESYRMARDERMAYQRYNRCRWDFPSSEAAKYARGRLALPEMLRQFELDSRSVLEPDD